VSAGRLDRGTHAEHIEVLAHVHGTRANSYGDPWGTVNLSAEEPDALMRARPGLWEPWWVTARATRPDARKDAGRAHAAGDTELEEDTQEGLIPGKRASHRRQPGRSRRRPSRIRSEEPDLLRPRYHPLPAEAASRPWRYSRHQPSSRSSAPTS
jgi:hypothetical protein